MSDSNSAIDQAIAKAQARKAAKQAAANGEAPAAKPAKQAKVAKEPKAPKATDAEKEAAKAARDQERAARKAERDAAREIKRAERAAARKAPHMSKVEKAAAKLPVLNSEAQITFGDITSNFTAGMVAALAAHLQHFNRVKATERALNQKVEAGATVQIVSGDARYIGMQGTVAKAQRIRCYVEVPGFKKPVYLFTSDVQVVEAPAQATGTEG